MSAVHISVAAKKDCYALAWSYGEICCGCGCCSEDPLTRAKARLQYHMDELAEKVNFTNWFYDDPEWLAIQKRNVALDIEYHKEKVAEYEAEVKRLSETEKQNECE